MGHRIQQSLKVILAGVDERDGLSGAEMETLHRELRILLQSDRLEIAPAEIEKSELVLDYMLRPTMEECLTLWFGKSEQTDQDIWNRFGADVALAAKGHYDHWALNVDHPRLLVALVIMLDQFPRNMYRDTAQMYATDARCLKLVKRGLRAGSSASLRPIERVFLCLALTHSESIEDQHLCMEEWGQVMKELAPDDPLNAFHEIFHRHVAVIMRFGRFPHRNKILQRENTEAEEKFLADSSFRFDLPLLRQPDGTLVFAGTVRKRTSPSSTMSTRPSCPTATRPRAARSNSSMRGRTTFSPGRSSNWRSRASSASATASPTSPPRPASGRSTFMSSSAAPGACSFPTLPISPRSAPPSSAPRPGSTTSGASAAPRSSD